MTAFKADMKQHMGMAGRGWARWDAGTLWEETTLAHILRSLQSRHIPLATSGSTRKYQRDGAKKNEIR